MSEIMMDNRGITNAMAGLYNIKNVLNRDALSDFLTYFVLWDEIFYPKSSMEYIWRGPLCEHIILDYIKPIDIDEIEDSANIEKEMFLKDIPGMYKDAVRYLEFSNAYGLNYCPSKSNSEFLTKCFKYGNKDEYNIKKRIIDNFFTNIKDTKNISGLIYAYGRTMTFPNFGDYIIKNTDEGGNYFKTALDIKANREFREFNRYLNKIEEQVNKGDLKEFTKCINSINEMTDQITKEKKIIDEISFGISLIPFALNCDISLNIKKKHQRQLNFLRTVKDYYDYNI